MLGRTVIYKVRMANGRDIVDRVAIINRIYPDNTVGITILPWPEDTGYPIDTIRARGKIKFGDDPGECRLIDPDRVQSLASVDVPSPTPSAIMDRMAKARAARGKKHGLVEKGEGSKNVA